MKPETIENLIVSLGQTVQRLRQMGSFDHTPPSLIRGEADLLAKHVEEIRCAADNSVPAQQQPEPVAWRWRYAEKLAHGLISYWSVTAVEPHAHDGDIEIEPLYASPSLPPHDSALREHVEVLLEQLELDEQHGFGADERDCPICVAIKNVQDALAARNHSQEEIAPCDDAEFGMKP